MRKNRLQGKLILCRRKADKGRDLRAGAAKGFQQRTETGIEEEHRHVRPVQVVRNFVRAELGIDGDRHIAVDDRAEQAGDIGNARCADKTGMDRSIPLTAQKGGHPAAVIEKVGEGLFRNFLPRLLPQPDLVGPLFGRENRQILKRMQLGRFHEPPLMPACCGCRRQYHPRYGRRSARTCPR